MPYQRARLARYAAYPLQAGKLTIDAFGLRYQYASRRGGSGGFFGEQEDPFFGLFQHLTPPRQGVAESTLRTLTVLPLPPLPSTGHPFTGGVGDFQVVAVIDRPEVHVNEPVTFILKIEGHGSVTTLKEPRLQWPPNVDIYDSKVRAKTNPNGLGERILEFLLIPRVAGSLQLPAFEFGFFNPIRGQYYVKKTEPLSLRVLEALPGSAQLPPAPQNVQPSTVVDPSAAAVPHSPAPQQPATQQDIRYLKPPPRPLASESDDSIPLWRYLYWGCGVLWVGFLGLVGRHVWKKGRPRRSGKPFRVQQKQWDPLAQLAHQLTIGQAVPWKEISQAYETLTQVLFDFLESHFQPGLRALSRSELRVFLVDTHGVSEDVWKRLVALLEACDFVRFASSAGTLSETSLRSELPQWIEEAQSIWVQIHLNQSGSGGGSPGNA